MEQETIQKFKDYEGLKIQEKEIKTQIDELKGELVQHIELDQVINGEQGVFTLKHKPMYTYSTSTTALAKSLKEVQKDEVAKGISKDNGPDFIQYNVNK